MRALIAFLLSVVVLVVISFLKPHWDRKSEELSEAQRRYQESIELSKNQLMDRATTIGQQQDLLNNIDWNLRNSINGILRRSLEAGTVSRILLFNAQCELIGSSQGGIQLHSDCHKQMKTPTDHFYWMVSKEHPKLSFWHSFRSKQSDAKFYLDIAVDIDQQWLAGKPQLEKLWTPLALEIVRTQKSNQNGILVHYGQISKDDNYYIASLKTNYWLVKFWPALVQPGSKLGLSMLLFTAILCVFLASLISMQLYRKDKGQRRSLFDLMEWVENLEDHSKLKSSPKNESQSLDALIKNIRHLVNNLHEFYFQRDRQNEAKIAHLNLEISKLMKHGLSHRKNLAQSQRLKSMQVQIQRSIESFNTLLTEIYDGVENAYDGINHGMQQSSTHIYQLVQYWQEQIAVSNPRKFIRSLSERVDTETGKTELDHSIELLAQHSKNLHNIGLHISISLQKALQDLGQGLQHSRHWEQLTGTDERQSTDMYPLILEAQHLVSLDPKFTNIRFQNRLPDRYDLQPLKISPSQFVSVIYHMYAALLEYQIPKDNKEVSVQLHAKQKDQQFFLILSMEVMDSQISIQQEATIAKEHLEILRSLLFGSTASIIELPTLGASTPLALSWESKKESFLAPVQPEIGSGDIVKI